MHYLQLSFFNYPRYPIQVWRLLPFSNDFRCTRFRFAPLDPELIVPRIDYVVEKEKLAITDDGKKALVDLSGGDMRRVLNVLQVILPH